MTQRLSIMQPYFLPYIGYFQLMAATDTFVVYDDVSFINRGWVNRNRLLMNGQDVMFTIPLKDASQNKRINEIEIANDPKWRGKLLKTIEQAYRKAPYFGEAMPVITQILMNETTQLSGFLLENLVIVKQYLQIKTNIVPSSTIYNNDDLKAQARILDICEQAKAQQYINAVGGMELYDKTIFEQKGITLNFIKSKSIVYQQFKEPFLPWLSILDVMMFNDVPTINQYLDQYEII